MRDVEKHDSPDDAESGGRVPLFRNLRASAVGFDFEQAARDKGFHFIAGVDEVGRGCLAGPVVAAACILDISHPLPCGLNDSKKLSPKLREKIAAELGQTTVAFAFGQVEADEIDRINILEATKAAMCIAVKALDPQPDFLLIDALSLPQLSLPQKAIIRGDAISASIAAASVIAKTYRDKLMRDYDFVYPQYGFANHVGYGTRSHFAALRRHGPCSLHRKTFRGVR